MSNNRVKNQQARLLILGGIAFFLIVSAISYFAVREDFVAKPQMSATVLPLDKSNPQDLWISRFESEKIISDQKMKYLEELVLESKMNEGSKDKENQSLRDEIFKFKQELERISSRPSVVQSTSDVEYMNDPFGSPQHIEIGQKFFKAPLAEIIISDTPDKLQHVDQVIPSGTSVKAILISSVDMPCGVFNSADPQPVKLRLVDDGHLPKKVRAKLKGGIIIGSGYGDLSNERVYIRIERLTQVRCDGNFIETGVAGYVTGEDGKYGVKGTVVDKSYKMVENAAISGFFSGVNQYLQANASRNCNIYEPGCNLSATGLATSGGLEGAGGAFDMLTSYYIKRAEQIRPIIEVSAGRVVDVTFIHNAEIGDLHIKEKVKQIRDYNRRG